MSFNVQTTLEKMADTDKDYRYMACNDLISEMGKDAFTLDVEAQKKIIRKVLELVTDASSDVQGLAVKSLGLLVKITSETLVEEIIDNLCGHLEKAGGKNRDVATLGLKSVLTELTSSSGVAKTIGTKLTPRILKTAADDSVAEVQLDALDVLQEMLKKFGQHTVNDHGKILKTLLDQLKSNRSIVRKRAIGCLGFLTLTMNDKLLQELAQAVIAGIKSKGKMVRAYVQTVAAISRSSGARLGKYLKEIVPLVLDFVVSDEGVESADDEEVRENCLQALESFVIRCPSDVAPFLPKVVECALVYVKHDPNYANDSEEESEDDAEPADDDDDNDDYQDDDDVSWKSRRAAAKVLSAVVSVKSDLLGLAYEKIVPVLIRRFKEREENVQEDVFRAFNDILRQTFVVAKHDRSVQAKLTAVVPTVIKQISRSLKQRSHKTRTAAFGVLKELVHTAPGSLNESFPVLVPGIVYSLKDKKASANLKLELLAFLQVAMQSHSPKLFQPSIKELVPLVLQATSDSFYKISANALRVITQVVLAIRAPGDTFDYKPFVKDIYTATLARLRTLDIDQDVKESSITAMGTLIAVLGDELKAELPSVLPVLLERLRNEITRLAAVQAFHRIATATLVTDLKVVLDDALKELSSLLRQNQRPLKQSSLLALDALAARYGSTVSVAAHNAILTEAALLVSDQDLFLAHLALRLCVTTLSVLSGPATAIQDKILPRALEIVQSPLLQGVALESLLLFFGELVARKAASYDKLLQSLQGIASSRKPDQVNQASFTPVAKAVAELASRATAGDRDGTVKKFLADVKSASSPAATLLGLLSIGEIGSRVDLGASDAQSVVMGALESPSEDIKSAASTALGGLTVGNMQKFMPFVLSEIQSQPKRQYLLLQALREVVSSSQATSEHMKPHVGTILDLLFKHCDNEEEGVRNVVAECLGKLAIVQPDTVVPQLAQRAGDKSANARATVITAVRFTITELAAPVDEQLAKSMEKFLGLLADSDINVRRATLHALNAVAHRKPALFRPLIKTVLPNLYNETKIKQELMREITVGPFKHIVDDGLDNRKAAFEVMFTLLETCLDLIDFGPFLEQLASGLGDHADIKALSHLMLDKLARSEGGAVLAALDNLVDPLQKTITTKLKDSAVAQDIERNEELIKGALRAVASLSRVANVDTSVKFTDFVSNVIIKGDNDLPQKYANILKENESDSL